MINPYAIGFACVAGLCVAGGDYVLQSRANGVAPGAYALTDYIGGYSDRAAATLAGVDKTRRQAQPARTHLPEDVAGWQRRDWVRDDTADAEAKNGLPFLQARAFEEEVKLARKAAREQVFEYVRGADTVRLSARFEPAPETGMRKARVVAYVAPGVDIGNADLTGHDIVQGVFFFRLIDRDTGLGADPDGPLMLQAFLGDGVALGVYSDRPVSGLAELLAAIDYDGLNAMLDTPEPYVGRDAPHVPRAQKAALLEAAAGVYMADPATGAVTAPAPVATARPTQPAATAPRPQPPADDATRTTRPANKRLTLSGGRSCLGASSGRLCD